jgi:hypothetical protein
LDEMTHGDALPVGDGPGRPPEIAWAERLYLAAVALLVLTTAVTWTPMVTQFGFAATLGTSLVAIGFYLLLTLATTRRGSNAARWLLMVGTGFAVASFAYQATTNQLASGLPGLLNLGQPVLMLGGAILLFRPAARAWFAAPRLGDDEDVEEELP